MAVRVVLLALVWFGLAARPALAQDQAGLVIVAGDAPPATYCVALQPGETLSGYDLLTRAGVQIAAEQTGMGSGICSLNGTGCNYPAESCFCQCQGSSCRYWSYWQQNDAGAWQYASGGASSARVQAGAVEGWVWGDGSSGKAPAPPALALGDICQAAPTPVALVITATAPLTAAPAATPIPAATPVQPALAGRGAWALAGLAALVIIPLAALLLLRRRKEPV